MTRKVTLEELCSADLRARYFQVAVERIARILVEIAGAEHDARFPY